MAPWMWVLIAVGWLAVAALLAFVLAGTVRLNRSSTRDRLDAAARATNDLPPLPEQRRPPEDAEAFPTTGPVVVICPGCGADLTPPCPEAHLAQCPQVPLVPDRPWVS
ncbi:hypothetical protein [Actinomycetospora chiangmaiensis]|uniref:hypothetical protein n=1 Tax=Actinomycetospora chiangmaiensis TaxID=402650 RepID=UPI000477B2C0|nr:hypothetical protein [Actinomycetospora chiangmaiensis]